MLQARVALPAVLAGWLVVCGLSCGGGGGPEGGPRAETFPIHGKVLVDGQPAANVAIKMYPNTDDPETPLTSSTFTDMDGNFAIGTYEGADGAPVGDYKLTFMWGQINLMTGRYEGPDKLKDRYSDPETTEFEFTVVAPENDWGTIELTTPDE